MKFKIKEIKEKSGDFVNIKYQPGFKLSPLHAWKWGAIRISKQMAEETIERWKIIYANNKPNKTN